MQLLLACLPNGPRIRLKLASLVIIPVLSNHAMAATCEVGTSSGAVFSLSHSSSSPDILGEAFSQTSL